MAERNFRLKFHLAPGDVTVMTPLVRDIALNFGDKYRVEVDTNHPAIFDHNPYIARAAMPGAQLVDLREYNAKGIVEANAGRKIHFTRYLYEGFKQATGIEVPMLKAKTDLHLSEYERWTPPISGRYWLMFAGGKSDVTIKHWEYERYQSVADELRKRGIRVVQTGGLQRNLKTKHIHPPLKDVPNIVGWGGIREMIWQIYHAEGIICPVTAAMHMASAFDKPVVVIAGGREPPWWEHYAAEYGAFGPHAEPIKTPHRFLHTMGTFDAKCCGFDGVGCWRNKVVKIDDDAKICSKVVKIGSKQALPACMDAISVQNVVDAVLSYYDDGILPAPDQNEPEPRLVVKEAPKHTKPYQPDPLSPQALLNMAPSPIGPMDTMLIGGKYTICVMLYGPYFDLHRKCLDNLMQTLPIDRMDLRIGTNSCPPETLSFIDALPVTKQYRNVKNKLKYPVMRQMLRDPACPITTNFTVWLDDNFALTRPDWANKLAEVIQANHVNGVALYGDLRSYQVPHDSMKWFQSARWHKGRHFRSRQGAEAPNGDYIHYADGAFWACRSDVLSELDVPDARLGQKGGDVVMGEQIWQAGFIMKSFAQVAAGQITTKRTRGHIEKFPWLA